MTITDWVPRHIRPYSVALYRQVRGDALALARRTSTEATSLDYLAQVEASLAARSQA